MSVITLNAQIENVPTNIKTIFSQKFPSVTDVSWFIENDDEWVAEFENKGKAYSVNFDKTGNWKETVYSMRFSAIPAKIRAKVKKELPAYRLEDASISETPQRKAYQFQLVKGTNEAEIIISFDNKVLKKRIEENKSDG
jgi:hypothetical protein